MTPRFPVTLLLVLAAGACARPPAPQQVRVVASDFKFEAPDSIAPGMTSMMLVNQGRQHHHLILAKLEQGHTIDDLKTFMAANPSAQAPFVTLHGAADAIMPGDSAGATMPLTPGQYVLLCYVTDPTDHKTHLLKGMFRALRVAGPPHEAPPPAVDGEILASDYKFQVPKLAAGAHTLRVVNVGQETHEAQLIRLNNGVSVEQYLTAIESGGPVEPPGVEMGGPGALSPGQYVFWSFTLQPGKYLLICFVPDVTNGKPHFEEGMVTEISVPLGG